MVVYKKYGETFKSLRKQRGFKLTSFEHLGISPAALCKFEKGVSLIKFDRLILALEELSITLSEYEKCLNDYELDGHELLIQKLIIAIITEDFKKIVEVYSKAKEIREQYLALAIKSVYSTLTQEEKEELVEYFERIKFWRYTDLYTFYLSLSWLELSEISFIIEGLFTVNTEVFNSLEHRNRVTLILCYTVMRYISKGYVSKAEILLSKVLCENYKHTMFTKNVVNFVKGFWESEFGKKEQGIQLMKGALNNFDSLSFPGMSNYYRRLYNKYSISSYDLSL